MSDPEERNNNQPGEDELDTTASLMDAAHTASGKIGPYKLLSVLGEGGFAVVYLAEQERPVKRRVALKVIKPGMDSKQVIARFEAERQALALLDHPNIAHVFDAGTTEGGHPYFAMEYVSGISITKHCDRQKLSIEDRLCLFQPVCEAVQHAHQKGIIHRDIKPSNILVAFEADKAVPKIIDFGIAKAITQPLTERTLFTEQGQLIGTPEYMSPEQVEMDAQDIDTRSDVYSLGVLLYELLTGLMPFDTKILREGGIDRIRQLIREQDPKTPSTRLTSLGIEAEKVAESRRTDVASLAKCLHKELEWIPLKAMRKDRTRRYRSASELADDIQNYLDGLPLIAGPESATYRVTKFVRRNRALVLGVAAVLTVLIAGVVVSTIFAIGQTRARAEAQAVADFMTNDLLGLIDPDQARSPDVTVRYILDGASDNLRGKFEREPLVEASIRHTLGNTYRNIGDFGSAETHLERAHQIRRAQLGAEHRDTLSTMEGLATVYWRQGRYSEAESLFTRTVEGRRRVLGAEHPDTLYSMNGLAVLYFSQGRYKDAESLYASLLEISRGVLGEEDVSTLLFMGNLATVYRYQGRYDEAEPLYVKAMENERRVLGAEHPDTLYSMNGLAMLYIAQGRYEEAESLLIDAFEIGCLVLGAEHPDTLYSMNGLAKLYIAQGRYDEAEPLLINAFDIGSLVLGEEHPDTLGTMNDLAVLYTKQARYTEAEVLLLNAFEGRDYKLGRQHPDTLDSLNNLVELYEAWGKPKQADEWRAKLPGGEGTEEQ